MYYSVCANAVFDGISIQDALPRIRRSGAEYYEFWSWWDQDIPAIEEAQRRTGLKPAALCTKFIPLNDPERRSEYIEGLRESIAVAKRLGCPTLISQIGQASTASRKEQRDCIVDGLRACAPILEENDIVLTIEPLNVLVDHPGYYLVTSGEGFEIVRKTASPNVKLLFDIYHQQISEGNLISNIREGISLIGHIHAAGNPGRHELLGENEICYKSVFAALKASGYDKAIGLEYFPLEDPEEGLKSLFAQLPL